MISKGWGNIYLNPYTGIVNAQNCLWFSSQAAATIYIILMFETFTAQLPYLLVFKIIPVTYLTLWLGGIDQSLSHNKTLFPSSIMSTSIAAVMASES